MKKFSAVLILFFILATAPASRAQLNCSKVAGSLPDSTRPAGKEDLTNPVRHVIVIMQENHSFDNYFGTLNKPEFYGSAIDGVNASTYNLAYGGQKVYVHHETKLCVADPEHDWNAEHYNYHSGAADGFVRENGESGDGARAMGYYDSNDLPFYLALANSFTVGDRYFSALLGPTFPNRFFMMTATAFGHIDNDYPRGKTEFGQKTIFDVLTQNGVSWKYYTDAVGYSSNKGYLALFQPMYQANLDKMKNMADYKSDLSKGTLPQVVFLDASFDGQDEHPEGDVQIGQSWAGHQIRALMNSAYWKESALFLTYDENGGFYDHVVPPPACKPDQIPPQLQSDSMAGAYDRYGFRVPFVAVSPFAKHHFVSHGVYDHTSILKYIENKFNLPALTARDANADAFSDVFDYGHPVLTLPNLPSEEPDPARMCR